ncbi:unnamed protein product, partial [Mesorhabditis belari]|uniref:Uncharacterized protein n=1 Tax=Mesorhabditis belari TaxID=2138241 RepID=A0AAF3EH62_9BILA
MFLRFTSSQQSNSTSFYQSERYQNHIQQASDLYEELFTKRNYNKYLSPVYGATRNETDENAPPPLAVHFELEYLQIFGLDAQSQLISGAIQFRMTWPDPRFTWRPGAFDGLTQLHVSTDAVWLPDNQFGNVKLLDDVLNGKAVKIDNEGIVEIINVYYLEIACQINITKFPFDNQTCELPVMSFAYDSSLISTNGSIAPDTVDARMGMMGNGEWRVTGINHFLIPFGQQQIWTLALQVKRVPNYYVYVIAIPCFVITLLSIIGMFWTPSYESEQIGKLGIGLTSLVSMTVLLDLLSSSIPKTAIFPLLGIYVVACVGFIAVACLLIMVCSAKDPRKRSAAEVKKQLEAEKSLPKREQLWNRIRKTLFHRHVLFQILLQSLNLGGFCIFLSFWK